ncbi:hypothetical protein ACLKA6_006793 [Drosophila palustris]
MFKVKELLLSPDSFENPIFRMHLHCFSWYGYVASTEQAHPWFSLIRCTIFTASIWISCALMLTRVFLSGSYENLSDGATSWATAVQFIAVSIATLNAYVQRGRVIQMLRFAHADLVAIRMEADDLELSLLDATQRYVRTITMLLWVPSVVAGFMAWLDCIYRTIFLPQTVFNAAAVHRGEAQPILLFKLFPFADLCDNFVIGYLGPWYSLGLGITTIPLWHTFITCLMKYITLKLQILTKRVIEMNIKRIKPDLMVQDLTTAELNHWHLQLCKGFVVEQVKIRRFVHELQQLLRVPVMADFIIFSVLMCFLFFALTVGKDDLAFAFYACEWYNFGLPVQKTLLFMMKHTQRPMKMRALLVDMNLKTFLDIVRGAYSYFNLLRSTHSY